MGTLVNYATEKGVALLTLTDPPLNAYTHETLKELDACVLEARFDDDVQVLVVTGQGEYFSAGVNVNMLKEADESFTYYFCLHASETLLRLENTPKLVIAAVNGHCLAGGLALALACDLRIARAGSFHIGLPDIDLGVLPGLGATQRLTSLIGKGRALELMVEGERLTVDEALEAGVIHKAWEAATPDEFTRDVLDYAHAFCAPGRASRAVGAIKRAVQTGGASLEQGLALERELQGRLLGSADAKEGILAQTQKRKPTFRAQ
jgi:enoyl-CoA hydratase/carnithine racemase